MAKKCVLISGPTVITDVELQTALKRSAVIIKNADNRRIETILKAQKVDLILIEVESTKHSEIELIQEIKNQFPDKAIVVIDGNGDRNLVAKAFQCGAKDVFRQPYRRELLVERVNAVLRHPRENADPF